MKVLKPMPAGYKSVAHYLVLSNLAAPGEVAAPALAESSAAAAESAATEPAQATATLAAGMAHGQGQAQARLTVVHLYGHFWTYRGDGAIGLPQS